MSYQVKAKKDFGVSIPDPAFLYTRRQDSYPLAAHKAGMKGWQDTNGRKGDSGGDKEWERLSR